MAFMGLCQDISPSQLDWLGICRIDRYKQKPVMHSSLRTTVLSYQLVGISPRLLQAHLKNTRHKLEIKKINVQIHEQQVSIHFKLQMHLKDFSLFLERKMKENEQLVYNWFGNLKRLLHDIGQYFLLLSTVKLQIPVKNQTDLNLLSNISCRIVIRI